MGIGPIILLAAIIVVAGFVVKPRPPRLDYERTLCLNTVPLPEGIPSPARDYLAAVIGPQVPMFRSAVVVGTGRLRWRGLPVWARFRFAYATGRGYAHRVELMWFGLPVLAVAETFLDGEAAYLPPRGPALTGDARVNRAANLTLWAEAVWQPAVYVIVQTLHWEPVAADMARLRVPGVDGGEPDALTFRFDSESKLPVEITGVRHPIPPGGELTGWRLRPSAWKPFNSVRIPTRLAVYWADDPAPAAEWHVASVEYNLDVSDDLPGV